MRSLSTLALAASCSLALMAPALAADAAAPAVEVSFSHAERFIDAGDGPRDTRITETVLAQHLQSLGKRWLAPGEQVQIVITDVDLAGRVNPMRMAPAPRVLNGGADWPRITLQYTRTAADGTVSRGEESVSDMNYLIHGRASDEPLPYEKQMLTEWFRARFAAAPSTAQAR
jgi:hypothetical protein